MSVSVAMACDHAGLEVKYELMAYLREQGFEVEDLGTKDTASCDYPDYADKLATWVLAGENRRGVLICGSGIGMSMAANRHRGIRAALCAEGLWAELARRHNDANVLCLGARLLGIETAKECCMRFLKTEFEGGRHVRRVEKMG